MRAACRPAASLTDQLAMASAGSAAGSAAAEPLGATAEDDALDAMAAFAAAVDVDPCSDSDADTDEGGAGDAAGNPARAATAASGAAHRYKQPQREFDAFDGLPPGLCLTQRYVAVAETGGAVYDAGVVLSRWLCAHPGTVHRRPVLELGCGPGLTALVACGLGAAEVLATDMDSSALALARENVAQHASWLAQCPVVGGAAVPPVLAQCRWGDALPPALQSWRERNADRGAVVLGADVLYDNDESFAALLQTLSSLLLPPCASDTAPENEVTCLLCFPRRRAEAEQRYLSALGAAFSVDERDVSSMSVGCDREMALIILRPPAAAGK